MKKSIDQLWNEYKIDRRKFSDKIKNLCYENKVLVWKLFDCRTDDNDGFAKFGKEVEKQLRKESGILLRRSNYIAKRLFNEK